MILQECFDSILFFFTQFGVKLTTFYIIIYLINFFSQLNDFLAIIQLLIDSYKLFTAFISLLIFENVFFYSSM